MIAGPEEAHLAHLRPRIHYLRTEDPERAIDDPGLGALAAAGWTIGGLQRVKVSAEAGSEDRIMLILWPPRASAAGPGWLRWAEVGALVAIAFGTWLAGWLS